jgi:hypothetical protein
MQRPLLGILAVVLLAAGGILLVAWPQYDTLLGACLRIGTVLGVVWLAWPQLSRLQPWLVLAVIAGILVVSYRPKLILVVIVVIAIMAILGPRRGRKRGR